MQAKLVAPPGQITPAARIGGSPSVQAKSARPPSWSGRGVVQRMENAEAASLVFQDNEDVVESILTYLATNVPQKDPLSRASELDVYLGLEEVFPSKNFPAEIQDWGLTTIAGLVDEVHGSIRKFIGSSSSGGGTKGGGWAMTAVRRAALAMVVSERGNPIFPGGRYTLHHKISRSDLKSFVGGLSQEQKEALDHALRPRMVGILGEGAQSASLEKLLLNMPPNLEIGPPADLRDGDPGSGFDGNSVDGTLTPRSNALNGAQSAIGNTDFNEVRRRLEAAFDAHGGSVVSNPTLGLWTPRGSKFTKR